MESKEEFWEIFLNELQKKLPPDRSFARIEVPKINAVHQGIAISIVNKDMVQASAVIYRDQIYDQWKKSRDWERLFTNLERDIQRAPDTVNMLIETCESYENAKNYLQPLVINYENNKSLLGRIPYQREQDLACGLQMIREGHRMIVSNAILEKWGNKPFKTMYEAAVSQAMKKNEPMLFNMASLIAGIETDDNIVGKSRENEENIFYVLTNREKSFASFYMLLPEIQEKLYDRFGSFYVLPSSIHETLIIPKKNIHDLYGNVEETQCAETLQEMVMSINRSEVLPQERLSDHIYQYDGKQLQCLDKGKVISFSDRKPQPKL